MSIAYIAHLRSEAARFAHVLRDCDPSTRVPSCPDWDADDLLWHLAEVFLFWTAVVRDRLDDPDQADAAAPPRPADHAGLLALYGRATAEVVETLAATPGDTPCWTWADDHTAGFVRRRMAQEALIHRLDAELTAGVLSHVDAALATDGVHEALQHFYGGHPDWAQYDADGPAGQVRATDTGEGWTFRLGAFSGLSPNTGKTYDHEPTLELVAAATPSFTVSAPARDLDAWLWNRPTLAEVAVDGDGADFQAFAAIIAKGVD